MFILTRVKEESQECVYTALLCHHLSAVAKHTQMRTHEDDCVLTQPLFEPVFVRTPTSWLLGL